jgi:hypothetical protein
MLKVANSIHTRCKLVQIVLTFLVIGITVIWCHSFTKLTGAGGKSTSGLLLNILLCFVSFYLLFYSSYIFCRRLRTTQQTNSSTTSSISPEEAQTTVILDCKRRCVNALDLDLKQCDVVYGWIWMLISMFLWICECLNLDVDVNVSMNIVIVYGFACWCEWMCWICMCLWMWMYHILCKFIVQVL